MQIIRATKTAEQAGAYYVRIQAMARKHQITLYAEFDEHDTPEKDCRSAGVSSSRTRNACSSGGREVG